MKAWTDYPFTELGDEEYKEAPIRPVRLIGYDGDKYCTVEVGGVVSSIKAGYVYKRAGRCCNKKNQLTKRQLWLLEKWST